MVGKDKGINFNSKNVVEHLAKEIDKVDLVQNGSTINETILERENMGANPILKGHTNQSQDKTHAIWKGMLDRLVIRVG